jgi:hypothetical protein
LQQQWAAAWQLSLQWLLQEQLCRRLLLVLRLLAGCSSCGAHESLDLCRTSKRGEHAKAKLYLQRAERRRLYVLLGTLQVSFLCCGRVVSGALCWLWAL